MPRRFHRGINALTELRKLACSFVAAYAITFLVPSRETSAVCFSEVAEACIVVVVRALGTKALRLLAIVLSSFETLSVALAHSLLAIVENILTIIAAIWRPGIIAPTVVTVWVVPPAAVSKTKRTIDAIRIRPNNHNSPACLRHGCARGCERNSGKHQRSENKSAHRFQIFSLHKTTSLLGNY